MQPSTHAMIWYFWRLSHRKIMLLAVLSAAAAFFIQTLQTHDPRTSYMYANLVVQVFLNSAFGGCLFMWGTEKSFLPHPCLLTLPLAMRRYLTIYYGYVIAVVGAISCAATVLHLHIFGNVLQQGGPRVLLGFWQMPQLCVALACLMQSIFHLTGIKSEFKGLPMAIATEILAFCCVLPVLEPSLNTGHRSGYVACAGVLFALASSYISLSAHRNGRQSGGINTLQELFDLRRGRTRAFSSSGSALFWLGWHRYGRIFPMWAVSMSLIGLVLAGGWALAVLRLDPSVRLSYTGTYFASLALAISTVMTCGAAFLCHVLLLMRNHEDLFGTGSGFFLTLPVRSATLARGRLLAMALSVLLVMAVGMSIWLILAQTSSEQFRETIWHRFTQAMPFALGFWLTLCFGLVIVVGFPVFVLAINSVQILGVWMDTTYLAAAALILSTVLTSVFLIMGIRRRLLGWIDLLLWVVACLPIMPVVTHFQKSIVSASNRVLVGVLLLGLLLPVALPFLAMPVLMDRIRHR